MILKNKKYLLIGIGALALLSLYFVFNPSNVDFFPDCPFHELTGYHCPGCGSQRAIHDLTHLNLAGAFGHNALMVLILLIGIGLYIFSRKNYTKIMYHPKAPILIFIVVVLFWIARNIPYPPFTSLAP